MKTYRVEGICMVPHEVSMNVRAENESEALEEAQRRFKANPSTHVVAGSEDIDAAWDWVPHAERIG